MKRILVILPKTIPGKFIMNGLADGLELNKCRVLRKSIDELTSVDIKEFYPDLILGHNYSFLAEKNLLKTIENSDCKNIALYFTENPKELFSKEEKKHLDAKLKNIVSKIFIWDKKLINKFKKASYLPLGISPKKYVTDFSGYKYSISFVGNHLTGERLRFLCKLVQIFRTKLNIFSTEYDFSQSIEEIKEKNLLNENDLKFYTNCWKGFIDGEKDLARVYNSSKINLNISMQGKTSINYRVFEVLASGGFLLTDEREDLKKYFEISKQLETYKNEDDLIDKINFYLNNLNIAQKIAQLGKFEAIKKHSFSARAKTILTKMCL